MHDIKTYTQIDHQSEDISFRISRMEDIWEVRGGKADDPHRHDYYTVLLVKHANGKHVVDFFSYDLQPLQLFFISPGQVHQVIESERSVGYAILFSSQFLVENNIPPYFIEDLALFRDYGDTPPLSLNAVEFQELSLFAEAMLKAVESDLKFKDQANSAYLKLLLIRSNNLCTLGIENPQKQEAGNTLLKNFKELVNVQYMNWKQTSDYAAALNVTPDHLNRVVKSLVGKTAKEIVQSRITLAAKRLICFSELSTKEIGYRLGFSEPANFSAFFKNETGLSPSAFKEKQFKPVKV